MMRGPRGGSRHGNQATATHVQCRLQSAGGARSVDGAEDGCQACREQQLQADLPSRWKADFVTHASSVFSGDEREQQAEQRIGELERLVGRLSLELEVAKKVALLWGGEQKRAVVAQLRGGVSARAPLPRVAGPAQRGVSARPRGRAPSHRERRDRLAGAHRADRDDVANLRLSTVTAQLRREAEPAGRHEQQVGASPDA